MLWLRRNETLKNRRNPWGNNALHIAARQGRDKIVRELLELGWDMDAKGSDGKTPLMEAMIEVCHSAVVSALLQKGANVNIENDRGMRSTHAALKSRLLKETV